MFNLLRGKHPSTCDPEVDVDNRVFKLHKKVPQPMPIQVTLDHVNWVASQLTGLAGISSTNRVELQAWIQDRGVESATLGQELDKWAMWMANKSPSWDAFCAWQTSC